VIATLQFRVALYATITVLFSDTASDRLTSRPAAFSTAVIARAADSVHGRIVVDTQGVDSSYRFRVALLQSPGDSAGRVIASAWFSGPIFSLGPIPAGNYVLEAARVGYERTRLPLRLPLAQGTEVLVPLYWLPSLLAHSPAAAAVQGRVQCLSSDGVLPPHLTISSGQTVRNHVAADGSFTVSGLPREQRSTLQVHTDGRVVGARSISPEQAYLMKTVTVLIAC